MSSSRRFTPAALQCRPDRFVGVHRGARGTRGVANVDGYLSVAIVAGGNSSADNRWFGNRWFGNRWFGVGHGCGGSM